jgi:hypothetical protein
MKFRGKKNKTKKKKAISHHSLMQGCRETKAE